MSSRFVDAIVDSGFLEQRFVRETSISKVSDFFQTAMKYLVRAYSEREVFSQEFWRDCEQADAFRERAVGRVGQSQRLSLEYWNVRKTTRISSFGREVEERLAALGKPITKEYFKEGVTDVAKVWFMHALSEDVDAAWREEQEVVIGRYSWPLPRLSPSAATSCFWSLREGLNVSYQLSPLAASYSQKDREALRCFLQGSLLRNAKALSSYVEQRLGMYERVALQALASRGSVEKNARLVEKKSLERKVKDSLSLLLRKFDGGDALEASLGSAVQKLCLGLERYAYVPHVDQTGPNTVVQGLSGGLEALLQLPSWQFLLVDVDRLMHVVPEGFVLAESVVEPYWLGCGVGVEEDERALSFGRGLLEKEASLHDGGVAGLVSCLLWRVGSSLLNERQVPRQEWVVLERERQMRFRRMLRLLLQQRDVQRVLGDVGVFLSEQPLEELPLAVLSRGVS